MDTSRQLPTHGDGLPDMREPARTLLESMVNEVMDAQADMLCGDGANARNGYRERGPATPVGVITLRIPELRAGTYLPEGMIERYPRTDRAAAAAVAESWANGVSTRRMERIARKMGMERLSRDRAGAMCRSLDAEVGEPASRDPGGIEVPAVGTAPAAWSSRRYVSPESMLGLAEPAGPESVESEASRRRGLMVVETAMELAGTGGGRHDAMMQMDSGGGPFPNDGLHQLFRHYPASPVCASSSMTVTRWLMTPSLPKSSKRVASCMLTAACRLSAATWHLTTQLRCASCWVWSRRLKHTIKINAGRRPSLQSGADLCCFMDFSPCRALARHRKSPAQRVEANLRYATGHPPL